MKPDSSSIITTVRAMAFLGLICFGAGLFSTALAETRLAVIGEGENLTELNDEEQAAYQWAISEYETEYVSIDQITGNQVNLFDYDVIWWHYDASLDLPASADDEDLITAINEFVTGGGGLFLSKFATQLTVNLGIQIEPPDEIVRNPTTSGAWGFYQMDENHSVFEGLPNPFATLSAGLQVDNAICWWTDPDDFDGIWLTDLEWRSDDGPDIVSSGEYRHGQGRVYFVGAGAFEWHHDGTNHNRDNLETYTANIIRHLTPPDKITTISFLMNDDGQPAGEQHLVQDWLETNYRTVPVTFSDVASDGFGEEVDAIWWHYTESSELPAIALETDVIDEILETVATGVGLKLSGFAAAYAADLGLTVVPDQLEGYEDVPDAVALQARIPTHRIFNNLSDSFQLRDTQSAVNHSAVWTDPGEFGGLWLASDNRSGDAVALGSLRHGSGRIVVAGSDAVNWSESIETQYFDNLELLTLNILEHIIIPVPEIEDGLVLHFPFDGRFEDRQTTEQVTGKQLTVRNNYNRPEWTYAPTGSGLRLDGFSTWLTYNEPPEEIPEDQLTVKLWATVESYPPRNAPFVNNYTFPGAGYYIGMEPLGAWYFALSINGQWHTVWGDGPFPKNEWSHIAGVFDKDEGLKLYRNGELVGTQNTPGGAMTPDLENPTIIGRDIHTDHVAVFPTGVINGIVDDVRIYNTARTDAQVQAVYQQGDTSIPPDLSVPESRYADDPHRPAFHAMPPAHWANEPHGLVHHEDRYHLFYQYNPSGPYWAHIHWGHTSSQDLLQWDDHPIALAPEPGFDSYGVWSGDAVVHDGMLKTIYTGVDGARARVGLAEMHGYGDFRKHPANPLFHLPPGNFEDFRDPYVWQEGDHWYLLIGSGVPHGGGGTSLLYRSGDLINWDYRGEVMGEGDPAESGEYWEMPMIKHLEDDVHYFGITDLPIGRNTYWLGNWENEHFTPYHDAPHRLDLINRFLSPAIERTPDGRIVAVGIIPNHISSEFARDLGWEHVFSFPREWYYHEEDQILGQRAARELEALRGEHQRIDLVTIGDGRSDVLPGMSGTKFEMIADITVSDADEAGVILRATPDGQEQTRIYFDARTDEIVVDLSSVSNNPDTERDVRRGSFELKKGERLKLHVFVDNSVIEVFVNDKQALATRAFPTRADSDGVDLFARGGSARANVDFWELDPAYDTSVEEPSGHQLPSELRLNQNYPNPFNSRTKIGFDLPESSEVRLDVYNVLGRRVRTLVSSRMDAGSHQVNFDAGSLASGVYIVRLQTADQVLTRKMMLLE